MIKGSHPAGELWTAANAPILLDRSMEEGIGPIREENVLESKVLALAGFTDVEPIRV
jgi:hypothetical protein